jgi:hypothetical protein
MPKSYRWTTFTTYPDDRAWMWLVEEFKLPEEEARRIFDEECAKLPKPPHETERNRIERTYHTAVNVVRRAREWKAN